MRRLLLLFTVVIVVATCLPFSALAAALDKDADPVPVVSSGSFTCDSWIHTSMDSFSVGGGELTGAEWSFSQGYVGYNLTGTFLPGETLSLSIAGTMGEMGYQQEHKGNDLFMHIKCYDSSGKELKELTEKVQIDDSASASLSDSVSLAVPDNAEEVELYGSFTCSWRTPYSAASEMVAVKVVLESKEEPNPIPPTTEPSSNETPEDYWTPPIPVEHSVAICRIGDLYGEVNVRQNDEDDDAYIFAWIGMELHHNDRVKTLTRSGCIISFADMTTYVMKEDTTIVLDIANEKVSKLGLLGGTIWTNFKNLVKDGSMEVEMSQAIAGARGTTFICEEKDGVSTVKVFEGTVEVTAKATGKSVMVSSGEMLSTDSAGKGTLTMFDTEAELAGWDSHAQQVTAEAMEKAALTQNDGAKFPILLVIVVALLLIAGIALIVFVNSRKKRKTAVTPTYAAPVQGYGQQAAKFCPNCGSPLGGSSVFCGKCGQRLP